MKLGVLTVPLQNLPAEEAFAYLSGLGVQAVELGTGGYTNGNHLPLDVYLNDDAKIEEYKQLLDTYHLEIAALSCHGNPVHPDKAVAENYHRVFVDTCRMAQKLGVETVVTFSGCPGDCPESRRPNWVTCAWPSDYSEILEWQWNEVLIPYWKEAARIAASFGVKKIAFEMHPGFCVYNPATRLRLRAAVGNIIGANLDPSHLIWQGIDPVAAIRELKGAIYHFHAKDTKIDPYNCAKNGVLDTAKVRAFRVPAGVLIEVYATTLHYAPCSAAKGEGFRVLVALPRGTNGPKPEMESLNDEDKLLWACNKWLLAHAESSEAAQGAVVALKGVNVDIREDI